MSQDNPFEVDTTPAKNTWTVTTKLLVGATLLAIAAFLLVRFNNIIGPLLLAFVLAYLFRPLANQLVLRLKLKWGTSVSMIYLIFFILIVGFMTVTGVALVQQAQHLVSLLTDFFNNLPDMITELMNSEEAWNIPLTNEKIVIGEWVTGLNVDFQSAIEQALAVVRPLLGQAGSLVGTIASSAFSFFTWSFFILITSFFFLSEAGQFPDALRGLQLPGATAELERLVREANRLWNAYLRGQLLVSFIVGMIYFVLTLIFGVRGALILGLLAGISRFVPYVGQFAMTLIIAVTTFLQPDNYLELEPWLYSVIVTGIIMVIDQGVDAILAPRIFSSALGVHPAALMISAIVAANLLGFVGLILAAPVLAMAQLILRYVFRKMVDLEPWPHPEKEPPDLLASLFTVPQGWGQSIRKLFKRGKQKNG